MNDDTNSIAREPKVLSLTEAVARYVKSGMSVSMEGFTHAIPVAAGHEIIRQGISHLEIVRMTADIIVDQLIAAGCVRKLVSSFIGNSSAGSLGEIRRRIERADPEALEYSEYSHYGMICRYLAGAQRLPFFPLRSYFGSDLPLVNPEIRKVRSPYETGPGTHEEIYVVPPVNPDVAIVHAQRADRWGNVQMWGLTGIQAEAVFASRHAIVTVEEIVGDEVVRSDPNRTIIPAHAVDAVVEVPFGSHPSFTQGYYDRDNAFYREWADISGNAAALQAWLDRWVRGTKDHAEYLRLLGEERVASLGVAPALSKPVNYGRRVSH